MLKQAQKKEALLNSGQTVFFPIKSNNAPHPHKHTEEINSLTFMFDRPFDYKLLFHQLYVYLTIQAIGLYRMKGLVWIQGRDNKCVIQSVGKRLDFDEDEAWNPGEPKQSTIVFIGKKLQRQGLEKLLKRCVVSEI